MEVHLLYLPGTKGLPELFCNNFQTYDSPFEHSVFCKQIMKEQLVKILIIPQEY